MIDFENLKRSYVSSIQFGLLVGIGYENAKRGNELLNISCKNCIDSGNYSECDKEAMKFELDAIKEALDAEINCKFGKFGM